MTTSVAAAPTDARMDASMSVRVKARNGETRFDADAAERILHAGLRAGIALPYECGTGTCGTCKAKLLEGRVVDHWADAPGRRFLKSADEFLMCQCAADGAVALEVADFVQGFDAGVVVPRESRGTIRATRMLTHDVMELDIECATPIGFDAGQFMLVRFPGIDGYRGWSMVNHEPDASTLRFVMKKKPGGVVSERLFSQPSAGSEVDLFGPLGSAVFYPSIARNLLCIAGGSGIAGMMAILARAARENYFDAHDGDVFFGVRTMADAFYLDEFSRLREQCGERLHVTIALSEEPATPGAKAEYPLLDFDDGFVHDAAARAMRGRLQNVRAYLAGPPPAVNASVRMLLMARVSTADIRYDKFS